MKRIHLIQAGIVLALALVLILDWTTPAGVAVDILLVLPVVAAAILGDPTLLGWIIAGALLGSAAHLAVVGGEPIPPYVLTNRIIGFAAVAGTAAIALLLQRNRRRVRETRDASRGIGDLNRLLVSLLAHDLRAPLVIATDALTYVEGCLRDGRMIDPGLLVDVRSRIRRSLRAIEVVLTMERLDPKIGAGGEPQLPVDAGEQLDAEVGTFAYEAAQADKELVLELGSIRGKLLHVNALVLRQIVSILLDNAIRYSLPGAVRIGAELDPRAERLVVRVQDSGPGLHAREAMAGAGLGLGLKLGEALARTAGGSLRVETDSPLGTCFTLTIPARTAPMAVALPGADHGIEATQMH